MLNWCHEEMMAVENQPCAGLLLKNNIEKTFQGAELPAKYVTSKINKDTGRDTAFGQ